MKAQRLRLVTIDETSVRYSGPAGAARLLLDWGMALEPQECAWVVPQDAELNVTGVIEVARGTHKSVDIHLPTLLAAVLSTGCERFIVAHNHPTGNTHPTTSDVQMTHTIMDAANACGLFFEDHVIVSPNKRTRHFSFVENGLLIPDQYIKPGEHQFAALNR